MALKSMFLIIIAIILLVLPGMLYNNLNANGLVVSQSQALTCSTNIQTPTCTISGNVGCQASASYCTLSGSSVSFLSHTSIFTSLLSGNIFGVWGSLNNQNSAPAHGPWELMGGTNVYQGRANCVIDDAPGKGLTKWQFHNCTESNSDTSNKTKANSQTWVNWNSNLASTTDKNLAFYQLAGNGSVSFACNFNFQLNFTTGGKTTGWTWYGCSFEAGVGSVTTDRVYAWWVAVPYETGVLVAGQKFASGGSCNGGNCYHENVQFALTKWDTHVCSVTSSGNVTPVTYFPYQSTECNQFWQSLNNSVQSAGGNSLSFGLLTPLILFIIGIILFIIGIGVTFGFGGSVLGSGTQGSIGANEQGSRLAQTVGLGLIIWVPLYSEFSTWFTSGLLPYGLDGAAGIMAILITGLFFVGIFWRMLERQ